MTPETVPEILQTRLQELERRVAAACARAGRARQEVTLVAVTKTVSAATMRHLIPLGVTDMGENRPQAFWQKAEELRELPIRWHLIGHLQRNKLERTLRDRPAMVHSVDSLRLLQALEAEAAKQSLSLPVLIEVNLSREEAKNGFAPEEVPGLASEVHRLRHLQVQGLMTMAAYTADAETCRQTFRELRELRGVLQTRWSLPLPELSMGMSNDFEVAIEEGSTLIRPGTALFEGLGAGE